MSNDLDKNKKVPNVPNLRFNSYGESRISFKLKELSKIYDGTHQTPDYKKSGIRFVSVEDISDLYKSNKFITKEAYLSEFKNKPEFNDILMTRIGDIGTPTIVSKEEPLAYYVSLALIKPLNIDSLFLKYLIESKSFQHELWKKTIHVAFPKKINKEEIGECICAIPTKDEQTKISNFLNLLDFRIQTQNKIIEDLKIFRNLIYDKLICFYKTEQISIKELINRDFVRMIKPSELKPFIGVKKYLSTSSVDDEGISSIETLITYKDRPSRASMYPINKSVWFAKMKNTIKVLKSNNEIQNSYVLSTGFYGLLCDERKINSDWLLETFRSNSFNNQKDRFSEGSSMSAIKDNQLEDILINLITNKADEDKAVKLLLSLSSSIVTNKTLLEKHKKQKEYLLENMFI